MTLVNSIYRLYIRGYYTAEQALTLGRRVLSDDKYAILEAMIAEEEARRNPPEPQPDEEPQEDTEPTDEQPEEETPQTED